MKEAIKKLKKHGILIWLLVVMIASTAFISYGAYTGLKSVKRVVTTQASPGDLFSSNCMRIALSNKRINTTEYTVTVCNYEQRNPSETNPSDITYTLTAEIKVSYNNSYYTMDELKALLGENSDVYQGYVNKLAHRAYSIVKTEDDKDGSLTGSVISLKLANSYRAEYTNEVLAKGEASTDKFKVTFDEAELEDAIPDFYVYLRAEAETTSNLAPIEGLLCAAQNASDVASWQGAFIEADCDTVDYDFYNYIISGSGIGTVDIMWDPEWFEINPFFFRTMGIEGTTETITDETSMYNGWEKLSLKVDSTQQNRYELQLYKAQKDVTYTGDNSAAKRIACMFKQDAQ